MIFQPLSSAMSGLIRGQAMRLLPEVRGIDLSAAVSLFPSLLAQEGRVGIPMSSSGIILYS